MRVALAIVCLVLTSACLAQTRLDRAEEVSIGGIRQFITVEAADSTLPLLLFLHGGPGNSVLGYADKFTNKLREHFIVVQWDQRETGRTLALNHSPLPLTFELFTNDTRELAEMLLRKFKREKLYVVAHSWGTALGFHLARTHPEFLHAYVAIGPMVNQLESEETALALMKARASKNGNQKAIQELASIRIPFESAEQLYYHRKWLLEYSGNQKKLAKSFVTEWAETWLPVFNEASKENLLETLPAIACPVYFFAGKNDYQTNSSIAHNYYQHLAAPKKAFYWFDTGHSIPSASPARMQDILIRNILPETLGRSAF